MLLQLTVIKNERPQIPTLFLEDKPITAWRGIHLFTGPTSLNFHKRQFEKILLPFKVNKVVVQCEQAAWKSFPNIQNAISISLLSGKSVKWLKNWYNILIMNTCFLVFQK